MRKTKIYFWVLGFLFILFSGYIYVSISKSETPFCHEDIFFKAAQNGDTNKIKMCLLFGKNVNSVIERSYGRNITALHLAGYAGKYNTAKYLIDNGADIEYKSKKNGVSPLWYSIRQFEIVKLLIESGAIVNDSEKYSYSPFSRAVERTDIRIIDYLLSKGANINSNGALCNASYTNYKDTIKVVSLLINRGANINAKTKHGSTALHCAMNNRPEVVALLIKSGADVNAVDNKMRTPIFYAKKQSSIDLLIKSGANVNFVSKYGDTPIFSSFTHQESKTAVSLIDNGAKVDIKNEYFLTPLIVAAMRSKNEIAIKHLINAGADKNVTASIDMINDYSKLYFRRKPIKTDKIELTAYDIAVIKWGKNSNITELFR